MAQAVTPDLGEALIMSASQSTHSELTRHTARA